MSSPHADTARPQLPLSVDCPHGDTFSHIIRDSPSTKGCKLLIRASPGHAKSLLM